MKLKKSLIGLSVPIKLKGTKEIKVKVKVDTGAETSSICKSLLKKLGKVRRIGKTRIKNPIANEKRSLVLLEVGFEKKTFKTKFTVANRKSMKYKVLLGKNTLKQMNILIDPNKE